MHLKEGSYIGETRNFVVPISNDSEEEILKGMLHALHLEGEWGINMSYHEDDHFYHYTLEAILDTSFYNGWFKTERFGKFFIED